MSSRSVDVLARLAASAEPPPLDAHATERLIDRALQAPRAGVASSRTADAAIAGAPRREPRSTRVWWPAAALALVAATLAVAWIRPATRAPGPELLHVALPTGDRLVGTSQARFDIERSEPADRRVRLHAGTLLADVAHVTPGQRFVIATAHLVATARGTVFAVETDAARTRVRVFEGTVEIAQDSMVRLLAAGTMWSSDVQRIAVEPVRPAALATEIAGAIERRDAIAVTVASPQPTASPRAVQPTTSAPSPSRAVPPTTSAPSPSRAVAPTTSAPASASGPSHVAASEPSRVAASEPSRAASERSIVAARAAAEPSLDELLASARTALASGKLDDALALARRAAARGATTGPWRIVTADALRGLGRTAEAVETFEAAARELAGADAFEAGYSAAYLALHELRDPDRALAALVTARVDAEDSPLEERGLVLHVRILEALHREADAAPIAARYLARYPHGELRDHMQALAKP